MTLVESDPVDVEATDTPLPDDLLAPGPQDVPAEDGAPRCRSCGSALVADEDWCLHCGTAVSQPRRTPGLRAVLLAGSLALVLTGGAVAASYAALTDEPPAQEVKVETLAKVTPLPTETTATTDPVISDVEPLPPVETTPVTPITPVTPVTPVTPTTTTAPTTTTTTTEKPPEPGTIPILLPLSGGSLYDPSKRATASGDPSRALDGDPNTSWFVTTPPGADMNVGYLIDLEDPQSVMKMRLLTKTPGFSLQVFGANGDKAPEAADSPDWTRLGEAGSIDGDAPEGSAPSSPPVDGDKAGDNELILPLEPGTETYRWVMLWVTTPPAAGTTVRFNEIRLYR